MAEKVICPTCKQNMNDPPRDGKSGHDCPQCGQGLSKSQWLRIKERAEQALFNLPVITKAIKKEWEEWIEISRLVTKNKKAEERMDRIHPSKAPKALQSRGY